MRKGTIKWHILSYGLSVRSTIIRGIDRADDLLYTSEQVVFLGQKRNRKAVLSYKSINHIKGGYP